MIDLLLTAAFVVGLFVVLPLCIVMAGDRIAAVVDRIRNPPAKREAERRARWERVMAPDFTFYEQHLGRAVPSALRALYADRELVQALPLPCGDEVIDALEPLDAHSLVDDDDGLGGAVVPIARTDFGDPIYLRAGAREADTVYITHHDGSDTQVLAVSVDALVTALRVAAAVRAKRPKGPTHA